MFDHWYDVIIVVWCISFTSDVPGPSSSKMFHSQIITPQNIIRKGLGAMKLFFLAKVSLLFLLVSSGFCLTTLPWIPFLPGLLLMLKSGTLSEASDAYNSINFHN